MIRKRIFLRTVHEICQGTTVSFTTIRKFPGHWEIKEGDMPKDTLKLSLVVPLFKCGKKDAPGISRECSYSILEVHSKWSCKML